MSKKSVGGMATICALVAIGGSVSAQQSSGVERKFELAAVIRMVRFVDFDPDNEWIRQELGAVVPNETWLDWGLGVRAAWPVVSWAALSAEASLFPMTRSGIADFRGGAKLLFLGGPVVRGGSGRVRLWASGRLGSIVFQRFPEIFVLDQPHDGVRVIGVFDGESGSAMCFNFGGGFTVTHLWRSSLDLGLEDLLIRYRPSPTDLNPEFSRHNLSVIATWKIPMGK